MAAATLAIVASCGSSSEDEDGRPSRAQCEAAIAQRAKLAVARAAGDVGDDAAKAAELAKHAENLAATDRERSVAECVANDSRKRLDCVLAATSSEALARCPSAPEPMPREQPTELGPDRPATPHAEQPSPSKP